MYSASLKGSVRLLSLHTHTVSKTPRVAVRFSDLCSGPPAPPPVPEDSQESRDSGGTFGFSVGRLGAELRAERRGHTVWVSVGFRRYALASQSPTCSSNSVWSVLLLSCGFRRSRSVRSLERRSLARPRVGLLSFVRTAESAFFGLCHFQVQSEKTRSADRWVEMSNLCAGGGIRSVRTAESAIFGLCHFQAGFDQGQGGGPCPPSCPRGEASSPREGGAGGLLPLKN